MINNFRAALVANGQQILCGNAALPRFPSIFIRLICCFHCPALALLPRSLYYCRIWCRVSLVSAIFGRELRFFCILYLCGAFANGFNAAL